MSTNTNEVRMGTSRPAPVAPTNTPANLQNMMHDVNGRRDATAPSISGNVGQKDLSQEDLGFKSLKERLGKSYKSLREKRQQLDAESSHLQGPSGLEDLYRVVKVAKHICQTLFNSRETNKSKVLQQNLNSPDPNTKKRAFQAATEKFRKEDNADLSRQQGEALAGPLGAGLFEVSTRLLDLLRSTNLTKENAVQQEPSQEPAQGGPTAGR